MTTASATSRVIIAVFPGAYHCARMRWKCVSSPAPRRRSIDDSRDR
jgi:hypothetical protein